MALLLSLCYSCYPRISQFHLSLSENLAPQPHLDASRALPGIPHEHDPLPVPSSAALELWTWTFEAENYAPVCHSAAGVRQRELRGADAHIREAGTVITTRVAIAGSNVVAVAVSYKIKHAATLFGKLSMGRAGRGRSDLRSFAFR